MRHVLNRLLRPLGYRIEKRSRFRTLLEDMHAATPDFFFVQIGANDGTSFDDLYEVVTSRPCAGLVVEPLPDYFERLVENYQDFPGVKPVRKALHPTARSMRLYRVAAERTREFPSWVRGIASFDRDHLQKGGITIPQDAIVAEDVPCTTLCELLQENGVRNIDYMQIDVEGFDAEVVKMIDFERWPPKMLKYEYRFLSPGARADTEALLARYGYRVFSDTEDSVAIRAR